MKNYGKTSLGEFRAIIAIAGILILAITVPELYDRFFRKSSPDESGLHINSIEFPDNAERTPKHRRSSGSAISSKRQYRSFNNDYHKNDRAATRPPTPAAPKTPDIRTVQCQPFDPNIVTKEELMAMGIHVYAAGNLVKYRNSGARFRKAEDLLKIYGMDTTLFAAIAGCIHIEAIAIDRVSPVTSIDVNSAGHEEWKSLPGIGDVLAQRVIKYREYLGGFVTVDQIAETYGLPPETMERIRENLVLRLGPKAMDLNLVSVEELSSHPYITRRQAEAIVNFRNTHGPFAKPEDVLQIFSLSETWYARTEPYLTCGTEAGEGLAIRE